MAKASKLCIALFSSYHIDMDPSVSVSRHAAKAACVMNGIAVMAITTTTASYLCHHPMLPVILVEILRVSPNPRQMNVYR